MRIEKTGIVGRGQSILRDRFVELAVFFQKGAVPVARFLNVVFCKGDSGETGVRLCQFRIEPERGRKFLRCFVEPAGILQSDTVIRSEERRVGKECRSRWSPY